MHGNAVDSVNRPEVDQVEGGVTGSERTDPRSLSHMWRRDQQQGELVDVSCLATYAAWLHSDAAPSGGVVGREGEPASCRPADDVVDVFHALEGVSSIDGIDHVTTSTVTTKSHFRLPKTTRGAANAKPMATPKMGKHARRMASEQQQEDKDRLQLESLARQLQAHTKQLQRLKYTLGLLESVDDDGAEAELSAIDRELMLPAGEIMELQVPIHRARELTMRTSVGSLLLTG